MIVLQELEKVLTTLADEHNVKYRIINIMSVRDAVGFYENNDYVECRTSVYWLGVGDCVRMAKPINNFNMKSAKILINDAVEADFIYDYIMHDRRKLLDKFIDVPKDVKYTDFKNYILENKDSDIFKETITFKIKEELLDVLVNGY